MSTSHIDAASEDVQTGRMIYRKSVKESKSKMIQKCKWRNKKLTAKRMNISIKDSCANVSFAQETSLMLTEATKNICEVHRPFGSISQEQESSLSREKRSSNKFQAEEYSQKRLNLLPVELSSAKEGCHFLRPYFSSIVQCLLESELKFMPQQILNDRQIFPSDRFRIINSLKQVTEILNFKLETSYLAVNIIDRILGKLFIAIQKIGYLAFTALWIAIKYEQSRYPSLDRLLSLFYFNDDSLQKQIVLEIEGQIFKALNFKLSYISPIRFIEVFFAQQSFSEEVQELANIFARSILPYSSVKKFKPSILALSCINLALSQSLSKDILDQKQEEQIKKCCYDIKHIYFLLRKPLPRLPLKK